MNEHNRDCTDTHCWCREKAEQPDMVNHPSHYMMDLDSGVSVEVLEIIRASLTRLEYIGYLSGNILKYNMRKSNKGGDEDMLKSCFYAERLKVILEG